MVTLDPIEPPQPQDPPLPAMTLPQAVATIPDAQDPPDEGEVFNPVRDVIRLLDLRDDQTLMFNFSRAIEADPELAGEAQRLGIETGLDPLMIERNIEKVRELQKRNRFQNFDFDRLTPALQDLLTSDPSFARIAHDDTEALGIMEGLFNLIVESPSDLFVIAKLGVSNAFGDSFLGFDLSEEELEQMNEVLGQFDTGATQALKGQLGTRAAIDTLRGLDFKGQAALDRMNSDLALLPSKNSSLIAGFMNLAGQFSVTLPTVLGSTAVGAAAGTVIPIPGVGTATGATFGGIAGIIGTSSVVEGGNQYLELVAKGVDPVLAAKIALPVGLVSGMLEATGFGLLARPAKTLLRKTITDAAIAQMLKPTSRRAILRTAASYAGAVGGEVATEIGQDVTQMFGDAIAGVGPKDLEEVWERISETIVETVAAVGIIGGIAPALSLSHDLRLKSSAEQNHELLDRLMKGTEATKTLDRQPAALERFFKAALRGQKAKTVYLDGVQTQEGLQQAGITVDDVELLMPGFKAKLEAAVRDGGDVVIPLEAYLARFGKTDVEKVLRQDVRLNSANSPSLRDLLQSEKDPAIKKEVQEVVEEALDRRDEFTKGGDVVEDRIFKEIQATGLLKTTGQQRAAAFLYRQIIGAQAARAAKLPEEIDAENPLRVGRADRPPEAPAAPELEPGEELSQEERERLIEEGPRQPPAREQLVQEGGVLGIEEERRVEEERRTEDVGPPEGVAERREAERRAARPAREQFVQEGGDLGIEEQRRQEEEGGELEQPGLDAPHVRAELFSALIDKLKGAMPKKAQSVKKWKKRIQQLLKTSRIKADEVELTGILDWFDLFDAGATVSAAQVNEFLRKNGVIVRRVQLGNLEEVRERTAALVEQRADLREEQAALGVGEISEAERETRLERSREITEELGRLATQIQEAELGEQGPEVRRQQETRAGELSREISTRQRVIDVSNADLRDASITGEERERLRAEVLRLFDAVEPLRVELEALRADLEVPRDKARGQHGSRIVPGTSSNYREVLMVLLAETEQDILAEFGPQTRALARARVAGEITLDEFTTQNSALNARREARIQTAESQTFVHGHFTVSKNVVAFLRITDRVDSEGNKVMFVEEIQSDWGQEGRKKPPKGFRNEKNKFAAGYRTPDGSWVDVGFGPTAEKAWKNALDAGWGEGTLATLGVAVEKLDKHERRAAKAEEVVGRFLEAEWKVTDQNGNIIAQVVRDESTFDTPEKAIAEANRRLQAVPQESVQRVPGLPLAPFVVNTSGWLRLALKQVFLDAVNGGYDKIGFINGPQSNQLYNLEHEVKRVEIAKVDETSGSLDIRFTMQPGQNRSVVRITVNKDQKVTKTSDSLFEDKNLNQVVNGVLADRIMVAGRTAGVGALVDRKTDQTGPFTVSEITPPERWFIAIEGEDIVDMDLESESEAADAAQEIIDDRIREAERELPEQWHVIVDGSQVETFEDEQDADERAEELIDETIEEETEEKMEEAEEELEAEEGLRQLGVFEAVTLTDEQQQTIKTEVETDVRERISVEQEEVELDDDARSEIEESVSFFEDEDQEAFQWEVLDEDGDRVGDTFDDESEADQEAETLNEQEEEKEGKPPVETGEAAVLESREDLSIFKIGGRGSVQFYGPLEAELAEAMTVRKGEKKQKPNVPATLEKLANSFGGVFEIVDMGPTRLAGERFVIEELGAGDQNRFEIRDRTRGGVLVHTALSREEAEAELERRTVIGRGRFTIQEDDGFFNVVDPLGVAEELDQTEVRAQETADARNVANFNARVDVTGSNFRVERTAVGDPFAVRSLVPNTQVGLFEDLEAAETFVLQEIAEQGDRPVTQRDPEANLGRQVGITVTDEMRQKVGQGLELFQPVGPEGPAAPGEPGGPRGGFSQRGSDLRINLNKDSDFSTWVHELGHYYMTVLLKQALDPNASESIREDADNLMEWFGIESVAAWDAMSFEAQRKHHEAFANNLEVYYFDGKAPSAALEGTFQKIRAWMVNVYQAYTSAELRAKLDAKFRENFGDALPEMNAKVRAVFDRMLASTEAINLTEAARGMLPHFQTQQESGMNDQDWATLQRAADEYHEDAITKLMARSLKAMQWLSGQTQGKLAQLQRQHNKVRKQTRKEVAARVALEPVYRAIKFLKTGRFTNPDGSLAEPEKGHKMDRELARAMLPTAFIPTAPGVPGPAASLERLKGMTQEGGLNPDTTALLFGYTSGEKMIEDIIEARPIDEVIAELTDQRMEAEHSDLINPFQLQAAIDEALHNPARAKFVAAEWRALSGAPGSLRSITRAARNAARDALTQLTVEQIRPLDFSGAEQRHRKAAVAASIAGDTEGAIRLKRKELLQHMMAAEAAKVVKEVEKVVDPRTGTLRGKFRKVNGNDKRIVKTRDIDFVRAARVALAHVGASRQPETAQETELTDQALAKVKEEYPILHDAIVAIGSTVGGTPLLELTLEQFRNVTQTVVGLWDLSLSTQALLIEERKAALAGIKTELRDQLGSLAPRDTANKLGARIPAGKTPALPARLIHKGWHMLTAIKRFQHYSKFLDQDNPDGPFQKYLLRPMIEAIDEMLAVKLALTKRLNEKMKEVRKRAGRLWDVEIQARADELPNPDNPLVGFVFRGKRELIDVLLDIGNPSNLAKRLVGESWTLDPKETGGVLDTTGWDKFFQRMWDDGIINQTDIEFIQAVWAEFAALREKAQETQRLVYGIEFKELEIGTITLPSGEQITGGYAPLRLDHDRAGRPRTRQLSAIESLEGVELDYQYSNQPVGPSRGFTIERNPNFFDVLSMDLGRRFTGFDEELRFIFLMPHTKTILSITRDQEFAEAANAYDPEMIRGIIWPWLNASARQVVSEPGKWQLFDMANRYVRRGTGVLYLGFKATVALVQLTGLVNTLTQVERRYLYQGWRKFLLTPITAWQESMLNNPRMRDRLDQSGQVMWDFLQRQSGSRVLRGLQVSQTQGARWALMPLRALQSVVDIVTWHGAYQQAIAGHPAGMDMNLAEQDARTKANEAVERAQGSARPESLGALETGTPFMRSFVQFLNYSNGVTNQVLGARTPLGRLGRLLWLPMMITFMETIFRAPLEGDLSGDEDEDGNGPVGRVANELIENYTRNLVGFLPVFGPLALQFMKGEADRLSVAPSLSAITSAGRGLSRLFDVVFGEEDQGFTGQNLKDIGAFLTIATGGIPIMAATDRAAYLLDVEAGKIEPTSDFDLLRAIITGIPSEASKRR